MHHILLPSGLRVDWCEPAIQNPERTGDLDHLLDLCLPPTGGMANQTWIVGYNTQYNDAMFLVNGQSAESTGGRHA
jgi:hypothetical protein